jgi:hypothetical protein
MDSQHIELAGHAVALLRDALAGERRSARVASATSGHAYDSEISADDYVHGVGEADDHGKDDG